MKNQCGDDTQYYKDNNYFFIKSNNRENETPLFDNFLLSNKGNDLAENSKS